MKSPALEGASTETVTFWLEPTPIAPELVLKWHQLWLKEAVQFKAAAPVLEIFIFRLAGAAPPETPVKVNELGLRFMRDLGTTVTAAVNVAVTDLAEVMVTVQVVPVPEQAPPHLVKVEPEEAALVRVTGVL